MTISSTHIDRADIQFEQAVEALKAFTGCFWIVTAERGAAIRVVPDGTAAIGVELTEDRKPAWRLRGPLLRPTERRFDARTMLVGVRLRPGVAFLLTKIPGQAMVDRTIDLQSDPSWNALTSIDHAAATPVNYIDAIQRLLICRLRGASVHPVVAAALREIGQRSGCVSVDDVAAGCRVSSRHLHRLMRQWIGYGPKRYASVVRFQCTLGQMQQVPAASAAVLANEVGYFDQAHLSAHVGRFAGETPGDLRSQGVSDFSKTRCDDLP